MFFYNKSAILQNQLLRNNFSDRSYLQNDPFSILTYGLWTLRDRPGKINIMDRGVGWIWTIDFIEDSITNLELQYIVIYSCCVSTVNAVNQSTTKPKTAFSIVELFGYFQQKLT